MLLINSAEDFFLLGLLLVLLWKNVNRRARTNVGLFHTNIGQSNRLNGLLVYYEIFKKRELTDNETCSAWSSFLKVSRII